MANVNDLSGKTDDELHAMVDLGFEASAELGRRYVREEKALRFRVENGPPFKPEEITLAKVDRCTCGAKLAFPKGFGKNGWWDCEAVLLGRSTRIGSRHTDRLPFVFWNIKTEDCR